MAINLAAIFSRFYLIEERPMGDTFKNNCFSDDQHLIQRFRDLSSLTVRFLALSGEAHF
ncbi:hypothetical protein [Bartonella apihabitans]|uniref:hypothetical protein n=1 Tax=Bartonella apihabitans TaxID=2750929 RepID=UPI003BB669A2